MPRTPGMFRLPNSAPDSLTPKNWNGVRLPEQRLEEGAEAVEVPDGALLLGAADVAVGAPGWH